MSKAFSLAARTHGRLVHAPRVLRLAEAIAPLLRSSWQVLDIGCGDGRVAHQIMKIRPSVRIQGVDVDVRPETFIPVDTFDGRRLTHADKTVDAVIIVDVLHHTRDPTVLLKEATRLARHAVVVKDHRLSRPMAVTTLRLMDWVGNRPHGVALAHNYWPQSKWRQAWHHLGWQVDHYQTRLGLYPWPASLVFELGLHFVARLVPGSAS